MNLKSNWQEFSMTNDKNKKNNGNNASSEAAGEFGKMLILGFAAVAAWIAIMMLSFSASLAAMGERYRDQGYNEWEILKSKTWRAIGILPFVLILAYVSAQYFPQNISIKNMIMTKSLDGVPTTETEYREIVETAKEKIESAETEARMADYSMESSYNESRDVLREYKRARTVEEKSEIEERSKRIEKDWEESRDIVEKSKKSIPVLRSNLAIARDDLTAFRSGKRTSFDRLKSAKALEGASEDHENANTGNFMWYGFLLVALSLPLSYPMIYFSRSDIKSLKNFQTFAKWLDRVSDKISYFGLIPFRFLAALIGSVGNSEEKIKKLIKT
jgi:hypothetical protein